MDQLLTQLMAGGILAILVIREVFSFLKGKHSNKEDMINREEFDRHKREVRYRDTCDDRHDSIQRQFADLKGDLTEIKALIRNGHNP